MVKMYYYSKGVLAGEGIFFIDPEGSQIHHIQMNNAPEV
jgi:hypothetical protein